MSEGSRLNRQWMLFQYLSNSRLGLTLSELAGEAKVSPRTVRHDLATLRQADFPIIETQGEHEKKRWWLDVDWTEPLLDFNDEQALAFCMGR